MSNLQNKKLYTSGKKDPQKQSPEEQHTPYSQMQGSNTPSEYITVTVIPCGREDGNNSEEEMAYEIKLKKKGILYLSIQYILYTIMKLKH